MGTPDSTPLRCAALMARGICAAALLAVAVLLSKPLDANAADIVVGGAVGWGLGAAAAPRMLGRCSL